MWIREARGRRLPCPLGNSEEAGGPSRLPTSWEMIPLQMNGNQTKKRGHFSGKKRPARVLTALAPYFKEKGVIFQEKKRPARVLTALAPYFKEKGVIFQEKNAPRGC